jgi:8-oxo-dGTP pyrophosphatase MutT (NUDIX family)
VVKSREEISAGGVVYRKIGDQFEVLICKSSSYHKWVLPKGWVEQGESLEETALREVEEEVGVKTRIIAPLGEPEKYIYTARGARIFKTVHYFLMEYVSGSEADHDHEMEAVQWVGLGEAAELLAYKGAQEMVARAKSILQSV